MKLKDIFTTEELTLIDSGEYKPGRAVLDAKLDLVAAIEREACAKLCAQLKGEMYSVNGCIAAIRARSGDEK